VINEREVYDRLGEVLDPELDQSLAHLGFVEGVEIRGAEVEVRFRLPTYWCAANFAYMMAEDIRERVGRVAGVERVTVRLRDHYAEEEINGGVNAGEPFSRVFAGEADGELDELRRTFARKAFLVRQEQLLRALLRAGIGAEALVRLTAADARAEGDALLVRAAAGEESNEWRRVAGLGRTWALWRQRRAALGLPFPLREPLFTTAEGERLTAAGLPEHLRAARLIRLNGAFNTMLCTRLNQVRHGVGVGDVEALPDSLCTAGGEGA